MRKLYLPIFAMACMLFPIGSAMCAQKPEVWLVHKEVIDLAQDDSQWAYVAANVDVVGMFIDKIPKYEPDKLSKLAIMLKKHNIKAAVECGGTLSWAPMDNTNGRESARMELKKIQPLLDAGIYPAYLDLDGPIRRVLHPKVDGVERKGFSNIEDCVDQLVEYMRAVREKIPNVQFFAITNFPNWQWKDTPYYWGEGSTHKDWGNYWSVVQVLVKRTKEAGMPLLGITVDNPYDFAIGVVESKNKGVGKIDWMGRVLDLERYVKSQGLEVNMIFNSERGGRTSEKLYYDDTLKFIDEYTARGGSPNRYIIESWYENPTKVVPETEPYTMTALIKAVIEKTKAKDL